MKKLFNLLLVGLFQLSASIGVALFEASKGLKIRVPVDWGGVPFLNRARRRADGWIPRLVGRRMYNAKGGLPGMGIGLGLPTFLGPHRLLNSNGDIDVTGTGFKYLIDTLSYISAETIKQKFYKIAPADFMTVDVGENPWSSEMIKNVVFQNGGSFYEGDINQGQGAQRSATVGATLAPVRMPNQIWAKKTAWTIMEIAQAAAASKWDIVSDDLEALKTNWDLGIQRTAFLGHPQISTITGLLNNASVTVNTSLLPTTLSKMTSTQLAAFVASVLGTYFSNSNSTEAQPDILAIPMSDFLGLTTPFDSGFPVNSRLEYLLQAFRAVCGPGFEIKGLAYGQVANNTDAGIGKQRAVLYKNEPDVLKFNIPVDITLLEATTANKINWEQNAYGQYSGVLITRPREVLYMDVQTS